ncbi:unnamed protein product [Rhizophagus irregularis]|uniref:Uncharacterized protein n=1 Tax=Rhizophagus irregularis TaxID=588596 RepID=A0A2I1G6U1_9GLOM|nr:hypothetical protein RhiirA4_397243 [Rhizophagus irregularis]CAB4428982.1 unnamed protein product [Rhizophagus irregularis]
MSSSTGNKTLVYDALKTLNTPTEDSKNDFFDDSEDLYVPESFSAFFGDVISEQDIQDAINQLEQEKQKETEKKVKDNQTDSSNTSDEENEENEENEGILSKFRKFIKM